MRLASYEQAGRARLAAVADDGALIDLNRAYASLHRLRSGVDGTKEAAARVPADALGFLALGPAAIDAAREAVAHAHGLDPAQAGRDLVRVEGDGARLLCPVPRPPKIVCVARNYGEHAREAGLEISEIPILFARFAATLVPSGDPVVVPDVSDQVDWEGELAVVIGAGGRHIARADAIGHVAGYSIFNDVTVRDYQFRVTQYTAGKNFHASGPFGPHLVLTDEVADPGDLEIVTTVNGIEKQRARTADMLFDVPTLIEHISEFIALEPGDVIATGTPAGVGFKRTPPEFLRPGDTVRVSVTGLGALENPVTEETR